jgi:hypothetical protein
MAKVKRVKAWAVVVVGLKNSQTIGNIIMITRTRKTARVRNHWNKSCNYPHGKVVPCEIVIKTKVGKIFRRLLCPDCGNIVDMEYVGYKSKPYKAHRYKCHRCGETCLSSKPKKAVSK